MIRLVNPVELGLPHRPPFLFVDAVTHIEPGREAEAVRCFPADDPVFNGHFPGNPIVPGVLLTEALAQTAGLAAGGEGKRRFLLSAVRSMKFPAPARPSESIRLHARKAGEIGGLLQFETRAEVDGRTVAEGTVVLAETP